ncbi:hypothetical protein B0H10DRAFT_1855359, partial [Mycena sp. CBHHK59/15]
YPGLNYLNFHGLMQFLRMARSARPTIKFQRVDKWQPSLAVPLGLLEMLVASLQVSNTHLVETCWSAFKEVVWDHPLVPQTTK